MRLNSVERCEVFAVEIGELFLDVHRAVEVDVAVRRMVVAAVKGTEILIRQRRNRIRIAARLEAVRRIGIKGEHDLVLKHVIGRG